MPLTKPKFLSFFAGARGMDLGLEAAGLSCVAANEFDRNACQTIKWNDPKLPLYEEDIRLLSPARLRKELGLSKEDLFAIVGGPPCQAFSTAGRRLGLNDERGNVFLHFIDLIIGLRPKYAVFENVRGLLSAPLLHRPHAQRGDEYQPLSAAEQPGGALSYILERLKRSGYSVTFNLYNTANFGVPQSRERLIFLASRDGHNIPHLSPTHNREGKGGLRKWVSLRDAIVALKAEHNGVSFPEKRLKYYKLLQAGENWRNLPFEVLADAMGKSLNSGGGRTGFYRRLAWNRPSPTLVTKPNMMATDLCHPEQLRPLSIAEYAAIQTFPPDYKFSGKVDDQYRQIGNAVPCLFGKAIGKHLIEFDRGSLPQAEVLGQLSRYKRTDENSWNQYRDCMVHPSLFDSAWETM